MRKVLLVAAILLCSVGVRAQSDPLNAAYKPAIDCNPANYPSNVALSGALAKLPQNVGSPSSIPSYGATQPCVTIYGTQNEFADFQIHVQGPVGGYSALTITVSAFTKSTGPGGAASIPAPDATHTNIVVYAETYQMVPFPTGVSPVFMTAGNLVSGSLATTGSSPTQIDCSTCNFTTSGVTTSSWAWDGTTGGENLAAPVTAVNSSTQLTLGSGGISGFSNGHTFYVSQPVNYPDELIPLIDPYYHQTTLESSLILPQGQNQSYWVDVLPQTNAPSGWYSGTVTIKNGATTIATLPVLLGVWQWPVSSGGFMPSTATLRTLSGASYDGGCYSMFGSLAACSYGSQSGDAATTIIQQDTMAMVLDQRYTDGSQNNTFPCNASGVCGSFATWETRYGGFFDGTNGHVNQILSGPKFTSYDIWHTTLPETNATPPPQGTLQAYQSEWSTKSRTQPIFDYLCDEPSPQGGGTAITTCISGGTTAHSYTTPALPVFITTTYEFANGYTNGTTSIDTFVSDLSCFYAVSPNTYCPSLEPFTDYTNWIPGSSIRQWWNYIADQDMGVTANGYVSMKNSYTFPNYDMVGMPVANEVMETNSFIYSAPYLGLSVGATGELYYNLDVCAQLNSGTAQTCGQGGNMGVIYPNKPLNPSVTAYHQGGWGDGVLIQYTGANYALSGCTYSSPNLTCTVSTSVSSNDAVGQYNYLFGFTPALCSTNICAFPVASVGAGTVSFAMSNPGTITVNGNLTYGYPTNTTVPLIVPTMRLKYVRDGLQQYEYDNLLYTKGQGSIVNAAIATWFTNGHCFNTNPVAGATNGGPSCNTTFTGDITDARISEGNAMQALTFGSTPVVPAPTSLIAENKKGISSVAKP